MGGKKSSSPATVEKVDPYAQAEAQERARLNFLPEEQRLQYGLLTDPTTGLLPQQQYVQSVREQVFPQQTNVSEALMQSILSGFQNPYGYTSEEQLALDALRNKAQDTLVENMRNRANLGGGLYGGRSARSEAETVGNLQNQFVEQDINRALQNRQLNSSLALSIMQQLFGQQMSPLNVQSPVVDPNQQYATAANQNNLQAQLAQQYELQQQANQNALYSSLFGGLGQIGGSIFGAGGLLSKG